MKLNALVVSALVVSFSVNVLAQEEAAPYRGKSYSQSVRTYRERPTIPFFYLEPVAGYASATFSGIEGKNGTSIESTGDATGGLGILVGSGDLQFDTGLFYSSKGATFKKMLGGSTTADFKSRYLDIPAMMRYSFLSDRSYRVFIRTGAVLGVLLSSDVTVQNSSYKESEAGDTYFNKTDFRFTIGLGTTIALSQKLSIFFAADYQEGLSKINKDTFLPGLEVFNSGYMATTGLSIGL